MRILFKNGVTVQDMIDALSEFEFKKDTQLYIEHEHPYDGYSEELDIKMVFSDREFEAVIKAK